MNFRLLGGFLIPVDACFSVAILKAESNMDLKACSSRFDFSLGAERCPLLGRYRGTRFVRRSRGRKNALSETASKVFSLNVSQFSAPARHDSSNAWAHHVAERRMPAH